MTKENLYKRSKGLHEKVLVWDFIDRDLWLVPVLWGAEHYTNGRENAIAMWWQKERVCSSCGGTTLILIKQDLPLAWVIFSVSVFCLSGHLATSEFVGSCNLTLILPPSYVAEQLVHYVLWGYFQLENCLLVHGTQDTQWSGIKWWLLRWRCCTVGIYGRSIYQC